MRDVILNICLRYHNMVDENICKDCKDKNCRHAGEPTTKERLDTATYGTWDYWNGEEDEAL